MKDWQKIIVQFLIDYGFQVLGAAIIFVVGIIVARTLGHLTESFLRRHDLEPPFRMLLIRVVWAIVMVFTTLAVLQEIGVPVLSLVAGLSVVGVGIGLAMQGVLSNLVAGLTIIFTKPFRVGEYIDILGNQGQVITIEMFSTTLLHTDKSRVVIPNRKIVGEVLHNYGELRQLELEVSVTQTADLDKALAAIRGVLERNLRVVREPAAALGIQSVAGSSILIAVRPWVQIPDYVPAQGELYHALVEAFRAANLTRPVSTHEVRLIGENKPDASR